MGELGCRILQLLLIHPTPTTYARRGRFGGPYAALNFTAIDPALAEFDPRATPPEQFIELVDAIHERNAKIIIDIAINHTGWAASLHETYPYWLVRDKDGQGVFKKSELLDRSLFMIGVNGRVGMLRIPVSWGELKSRYDAHLAANLHPEFPEDRWVMFTRCRGWILFQGYSHEINFDCFDSFSFAYDLSARWKYRIPIGRGMFILFTIRVEMIQGENAMRMVFFSFFRQWSRRNASRP